MRALFLSERINENFPVSKGKGEWIVYRMHRNILNRKSICIEY